MRENVGVHRIALHEVLMRPFGKPIVTRLESGKFYLAERSHQDFMKRNPMHPYILAHDVPKVNALKRTMPNLYRS